MVDKLDILGYKITIAEDAEFFLLLLYSRATFLDDTLAERNILGYSIAEEKNTIAEEFTLLGYNP